MYFVRSIADSKHRRLEQMVDVQYKAAGIFARDPATGRRHQATRIRNGEQRLTTQGRRLFTAGWVDFMISVPTVEQQVANADHPIDPRPRDTYTTFSENDYPGIEAMLRRHLQADPTLAFNGDLSEYLQRAGATLPQGFKDELLDLVDVNSDGLRPTVELSTHRHVARVLSAHRRCRQGCSSRSRS